MTTITNTSTVGIYITEEENAQIAGNTPGGIDLAALVDGSTYVYCDVILSFDDRLNFMYTDAFKGHKPIAAYAAGGTGSTSGYKEAGLILMVLEMTEANLFKWQTFAMRRNRSAKKTTSQYLVKQKAANSFRAFPLRTFTSKYYTEVLVLDIDALEVAGNTDLQRVTVTLQKVQQS